jgi:hypothetical protein
MTVESEAATLKIQQNAENSLANLKQMYEEER